MQNDNDGFAHGEEHGYRTAMVVDKTAVDALVIAMRHVGRNITTADAFLLEATEAARDEHVAYVEGTRMGIAKAWEERQAEHGVHPSRRETERQISGMLGISFPRG